MYTSGLDYLATGFGAYHCTNVLDIYFHVRIASGEGHLTCENDTLNYKKKRSLSSSGVSTPPRRFSEDNIRQRTYKEASAAIYNTLLRDIPREFSQYEACVAETSHQLSIAMAGSRLWEGFCVSKYYTRLVDHASVHVGQMRLHRRVDGIYEPKIIHRLTNPGTLAAMWRTR